MTPRCSHRTRTTLVVLALLAAAVVRPAWPAVQIRAGNSEPFTLRERGGEDTTAWYDAEEFLGHFPGSVRWDPAAGRLTYREGSAWFAISTQAPYAMRNGAPLAGAEAPRAEGGKLWLAESFLRRFAAELMGRELHFDSPGPRGRLVLDPGHGGDTAGARSAGSGGEGSSLEEKQLALQVALALATELRGRGYLVYLTREGDRSVTAEQRAAVSNFREADLFLALHVAGDRRPQARGFEVFVAPAPPQGADPRRWEFGYAPSHAASLRWAQVLRTQLGRSLATFDRGVGELPNPTLEAVQAPACLLELGSPAWPADAELLRTGPGRGRLAGAVAAAVDAFLSNSN